SIKPAGVEEKNKKSMLTRAPGIFPVPGMSRMYNMDMGDMESIAPFVGGMMAQGMGGLDQPGQLNATDDSTNMVELAVYGMISLYQRYPPKQEPPADATASTAGVPGVAPAAAPK